MCQGQSFGSKDVNQIETPARGSLCICSIINVIKLKLLCKLEHNYQQKQAGVSVAVLNSESRPESAGEAPSLFVTS